MRLNNVRESPFNLHEVLVPGNHHDEREGQSDEKQLHENNITFPGGGATVFSAPAPRNRDIPSSPLQFRSVRDHANSFIRLCVPQIRFHSPFADKQPRFGICSRKL